MLPVSRTNPSENRKFLPGLPAEIRRIRMKAGECPGDRANESLDNGESHYDEAEQNFVRC